MRAIYPAVDPVGYQWLQCSSGMYKRRPLSSESMWVCRAMSARELYLGTTLCLVRPLSPGDLAEALRLAWLRLRWKVPELCLGHLLDAETSWLGVEIPSEDEAKVWASRTLLVESDVKICDFEAARKILSGMDEQACLLAYFSAPEKLSEIQDIHLMIKADHLCMDGIGIRIFMGCFLTLLTNELDPLRPELEDLDWSTCAENLTQPWLNLLQRGQEFGGKDFEAAVDKKHRLLFSQMVCRFPDLEVCTNESRLQTGASYIKIHPTSRTKEQSSMPSAKQERYPFFVR